MTAFLKITGPDEKPEDQLTKDSVLENWEMVDLCDSTEFISPTSDGILTGKLNGVPVETIYSSEFRYIRATVGTPTPAYAALWPNATEEFNKETVRVKPLFADFDIENYEYECGAPCTPNGCGGHHTDIPVSIHFGGVQFYIAGYEAGDFPNKQDIPQVVETVSRLHNHIRQQQAAFDLLTEFLCDQETLAANIQNEALCEKARALLKEAGQLVEP